MLTNQVHIWLPRWKLMAMDCRILPFLRALVASIKISLDLDVARE